jgi:hypothetical protein
MKSPVAISLYIIIAGSIITAAWCAFSLEKDNVIKDNGKISAPASLILHVVTVICALIATSAIPSAKYTIGSIAVLVLQTIFFAAALVSFLANPAIWSKSRNKDALSLISGCATVLLTLCTIALLYFDVSVEMNNPQKILIQLSMTAICLAELSKMRIMIYQNGYALHIFAKLVALTLSPAATVAALVAFFAKAKSFSSFYLCTAITVGFYAIFYLLTLIFSSIDTQEREAVTDILKENADETAKSAEE